MTMKHVALSLAIALGLAAVAAPAPAQDGPKLYVFTSGSLGGFPKAALQMGGQGNIDWAPVSFYVLKHPKGNVIIDTGNNDKTITDPEGWWGPLAKGFGLKMTKDDAIPAQLAKIGLKTDDIKYVVAGHLHLDHGGNAIPRFDRVWTTGGNEGFRRGIGHSVATGEASILLLCWTV